MTDENGLHVSGLGGEGGIRGSCQGGEGDDRDDNVLPPDLDPGGRTAFHTFQRVGAQPQQPLDRMGGQPEHPPLRLEQQQRLARRRERHVQQNLGAVRDSGAAAEREPCSLRTASATTDRPMPRPDSRSTSAAVEKPGVKTRASS